MSDYYEGRSLVGMRNTNGPGPLATIRCQHWPTRSRFMGSVRRRVWYCARLGTGIGWWNGPRKFRGCRYYLICGSTIRSFDPAGAGWSNVRIRTSRSELWRRLLIFPIRRWHGYEYPRWGQVCRTEMLGKWKWRTRNGMMVTIVRFLSSRS